MPRSVPSVVPPTSAADGKSASPAESDLDLVGDRTRLVNIGMAAVFSACVVFAALRLIVALQTGRATPWWGNALGALSIAVLHLWCRRDSERRSSVGVHGTALIATIALIIPAFYGMSSSKWWLALVGFAVILMGRRREAIVWAWVTAILLPLTVIFESRVQVPNAIGEPTIERAMAGLFFVVLLIGMTASFRRVADRRARELSETAASLARANAVKSRFLAHMSHEVRTPLHGVIAMTDMAMRGDASASVHQQIRSAQQSARLLLGLLNNVLDVARAESDALELERRPLHLHALIGEVLAPLAAQARGNGLSFDARAEPNVIARRLGDRVRLSQIALNLVGNALKFTERGSITVRLSAVVGSPDRIAIAVTDTGVGIANDKLEEIFEPFAQANVADASREGGAGLGLAIVRELARRMDGSVRVESERGRGSTFTVELLLPWEPQGDGAVGPEDLLSERDGLASSALSANERLATSSSSVRDDVPIARALRVLVCEDNAINRTVVMAMLRHLGHDAEVVDDGARGWDALQAAPFDLLITDIEMPVLDGVALTQKVRAHEQATACARLPIIGATAHVGEEEQHRLIEAGLDAHLPKPFLLADLQAVIARVVAVAPASTVGS